MERPRGQTIATMLAKAQEKEGKMIKVQSGIADEISRMKFVRA